MPASWVRGEARGFRGLPGLRRGESPSETERERDRHAEREAVRETELEMGWGERREATDRLTQEIREEERDDKTANERHGQRLTQGQRQIDRGS